MRRLMFCLVLCVPSAVTEAEVPVWPEPDVEVLINQCWAASHDQLHSDTPLRIGQGVSAVVACLEYQIVLMVEASLDCAQGCGTALNNVGGFELARRLEDILRDLAAERQR